MDVVDRGSYLGECEAVPIPLPINLARRSDVFLHGAVLSVGGFSGYPVRLRSFRACVLQS